MQSILEFIRYPSHSRTLGFLALLVVLLSIPLTVNIAQKQQEIRQQASCQTCPNGGSPGSDGNCWTDPVNKVGFNGPSSNCQNQTGPTPPSQNQTGSTNCPTGCTPRSRFCTDRDDSGHCTDFAEAGCYRNGTDLLCASSTPPQTPAPTPATQNNCPVFPGSGSCTYTGVGQTSPNTNDCTGNCPTGTKTSSGATTFTGTSVKECQTNNCFYDRYYDTNQTQAWRTAACYDTNHQCQAAAAAGTCPQSGGFTGQLCNENLLQQGGTLCTVNCPSFIGPIPNIGHSKLECKTPPGSSTSCIYDPYKDPSISNKDAYCWKPDNSGVIQCTASSTPTATPITTAAPTPTPPPPGSTILSFTNIVLDGIGLSTGRGGPNPPAVNPRTLIVDVINSQTNTAVTTISNGSLVYDSSNGKWKGTAAVSAATLPTGSYIFKIKSPNFIKKTELTAQITGGISNDLSASVALPTGDIDGSGAVDALDVGILVSCSIYSKDQTKCDSNSNFKSLSDLNQDGRVDEFDYNLILREFNKSDQ